MRNSHVDPTMLFALSPAQFWAELASQETQRDADKADAAAMPRYRISADWRGGGFSITKPFPSMRDAECWAKDKARAHADAVIRVRERPSDRKLASDFAGPAFPLKGTK